MYVCMRVCVYAFSAYIHEGPKLSISRINTSDKNSKISVERTSITFDTLIIHKLCNVCNLKSFLIVTHVQYGKSKNGATNTMIKSILSKSFSHAYTLRMCGQRLHTFVYLYDYIISRKY